MQHTTSFDIFSFYLLHPFFLFFICLFPFLSLTFFFAALCLQQQETQQQNWRHPFLFAALLLRLPSQDNPAAAPPVSSSHQYLWRRQLKLGSSCSNSFFFQFYFLFFSLKFYVKFFIKISGKEADRTSEGILKFPKLL